MIKKMFFAVLLLLGVLITSCSSDDDNGTSLASLTLNLTGLEDLGNDFVYEGWLIINGSPVSTGVLPNVNFPQTVEVSNSDYAASWFIYFMVYRDPSLWRLSHSRGSLFILESSGS
jgi:hypothetical protein